MSGLWLKVWAGTGPAKRGVVARWWAAGLVALTVVAVVVVESVPANALPPGNGGIDPGCLFDATGSLSVSSSTVVLGQTVVLRWEVQADCPVAVHVIGPGFANETLARSGSRAVAPSSNSSWILQLSQPLGLFSDKASASVTVQLPQEVSITSN